MLRGQVGLMPMNFVNCSSAAQPELYFPHVAFAREACRREHMSSRRRLYSGEEERLPSGEEPPASMHERILFLPASEYFAASPPFFQVPSDETVFEKSYLFFKKEGSFGYYVR